jgi:Vault protein inter-alpha-trypsin domain/PEP-CTERM motif
LWRDVNFDVVRLVAGGNNQISADQARTVYYQVTGRPFNSVPPPSLYTRRGRWNAVEQEFEWDGALGGETVAGRVKGLSLLSSRMDAVAEPDASVVYCEWTLEFKNVATQEREARAQIALPPGAVVSRLTLWINGEEREAAFSGRSQVRQAYQQVAVVQRHDPVLVTTCGPDRVLMQCFPVPANGGVMKVRIGLTAPLVLHSLEQGQFLWPHLLERNFGIAADFKHALWIESPGPLSGDTNAVVTAKSDTRPFSLHQSLLETDFGQSAQRAVVHRSAEVKTVWSPAEDSGQIIRQTIRPAASSAPKRLIVVVDGSAGMQKYVREITEALSDLPPATELAVVLAGDEVRFLNGNPQPITPELLTGLARSLRQAQFVGGQDNMPALEMAWDFASSVEHGAIVWIHEPQPALLSAESTLRQHIERDSIATRLYEIQMHNGPDRIVEKLDGLAAVQQVPRFGSVRADLGGLFAEWNGKRARFELARELIAASSEASAGLRCSKHIVRLWARDETLRLAGQRQREEAIQLAAKNQLVTPLTGAVVLETQQQFTQNRLTPADPKSVPAVPEPSTMTLVALGIAAWLMRRIFRRTRSVG